MLHQRGKLIHGSIFFAALVLLMTSVAVAATVTVSAGSLEAQPGGTVEVPVQLAGANGLGAMHLELTYDPSVLTAQDVTRGALAGSNALVESNSKQPGRLVIGIVSLDGIKGDGVLAGARFKVIGDAGKSSELRFENNQAWERESHAEVLVNSQPGKVTIAAGLPSWLIPAAIALVVALVLVALIFFAMSRRRRPAPQPAYGMSAAPFPPPASYTPPRSDVRAERLTSSPGRAAPPPPTDLPERHSAAASGAANSAAFKPAEDEYFRLKGQLATGRVTHDQFEARLRELMVTDDQGRYWMLGADSAKWYVHDGQTWIEGQPY